MPVGRFVRTTLADWKGRDCCRLEFRGYDVRCPFLGGSELYEIDGPVVDSQEIFDYVKSRKDNLEGIVLGGGEPLADPGLYPFLKELRRYKVPVLLETWGMRPDELDDLAGAMMFDEVRLYVPAAPDSPKLSKATGGTADPSKLKRSVEILNGLDVPHGMWTWAVPGISGPEELSEIARLTGPKTTLTLSQFNPEKAAFPEYRKVRPYSRSEVSAMVASAKRYSKHVSLAGF